MSEALWSDAEAAEMKAALHDIGASQKDLRAVFKTLDAEFPEAERELDAMEAHLPALRALDVRGRTTDSLQVSEGCARHLGALVLLGAKLNKALDHLSEAQRQRCMLEVESVLGPELMRAPITVSDVPLPEQYSAELVQLVSRYGKARKYGTTYELGKGSETTKLPRLRTSPAFGYMAMGEAIPEKSPQLELVALKPSKAGGLLRIPAEIDADAVFNLGIFVADYAARELARFEDVVFWTADGSATYKLMKGAGKYAVDLGRLVQLGAGNTRPSNITLTDLRAMRAQVEAAALINGAYYFHPSMEAHFVSFNAGRHDNPVFRRTDEGGVLEEFPVRWVEALPVFDTAPHVSQIQGVFGDISYMYLGVRPGITFQSSRDAFFTTDEIAVRCLERFCVAQMADASVSALQLAAS